MDRLRWYADEQDAPRDAYDLTNEAADEIMRLRRWKDEATTALAQHDAAWEAAERPGRWGEMKSVSLTREIVRLRTRVAELEAATDGWNAEPALADQLAEALSDGAPVTDCWCSEMVSGRCLGCRSRDALAAYDRARTPATPTEDQ